MVGSRARARGAARPGDLVLTMGAGDVSMVGPEVLAALRAADGRHGRAIRPATEAKTRSGEPDRIDDRDRTARSRQSAERRPTSAVTPLVRRRPRPPAGVGVRYSWRSP